MALLRPVRAKLEGRDDALSGAAQTVRGHEDGRDERITLLTWDDRAGVGVSRPAKLSVQEQVCRW
jgi:hypothetical protein